jgi:hypothetical protein
VNNSEYLYKEKIRVNEHEIKMLRLEREALQNAQSELSESVSKLKFKVSELEEELKKYNPYSMLLPITMHERENPLHLHMPTLIHLNDLYNLEIKNEPPCHMLVKFGDIKENYYIRCQVNSELDNDAKKYIIKKMFDQVYRELLSHEEE